MLIRRLQIWKRCIYYLKRLFNVSGRPVTSNCGLPREKVLEFLKSHLKGIMQESWSYIKDSGDFINKMKNLKDILQDTLLVMADAVGLYPSILNEAGLKALKEALDKRDHRNIATNDLIRMAEFVLKNNCFSNLMARLNSKYLKQPLVPNLHLHMLAFLWMTLKVNFLKLNHYNH